MTDQERETVIECYRRILVDAQDERVKRYAALRMRELIADRSPERVAQMERERGLRVS